jgi:catechol 2,3-dioxygenase-like lactoylglutathione lyase family enzyme
MLLLFNPLASREPNERFPPHGSFGAGHVAFGAGKGELPQWINWLEQRGVAIEKVLDWPDGGRSLYFRDPANNLVELVTPRIWGLEEA